MPCVSLPPLYMKVLLHKFCKKHAFFFFGVLVISSFLSAFLQIFHSWLYCSHHCVTDVLTLPYLRV